MIENLAYYIFCFTNHNHYNFADSIRQHYKKHIVIEMCYSIHWVTLSVKTSFYGFLTQLQTAWHDTVHVTLRISLA